MAQYWSSAVSARSPVARHPPLNDLTATPRPEAPRRTAIQSFVVFESMCRTAPITNTAAPTTADARHAADGGPSSIRSSGAENSASARTSCEARWTPSDHPS